MARKRMLSPEMFTSATVCGWRNPATRWTWAGVTCYLDDFGYGEDSAALVKAAVWPRDDFYTVKKVAADLDAIVERGALCRFICCDKPQFHSPNWTSWQKVSHPTPSRCCPCPTHAADVSRIHREEFRSGSGAAPRNVVQENLEEGSSRAGGPSDPPPPGSDGLAAARAMVGRLNRRSSPENQATAQDVA